MSTVLIFMEAMTGTSSLTNLVATDTNSVTAFLYHACPQMCDIIETERAEYLDKYDEQLTDAMADNAPAQEWTALKRLFRYPRLRKIARAL